MNRTSPYNDMNTFVKGSSDLSHFIFEINVGKSRIGHRTAPDSNDRIFQNLTPSKIQIRSMSDPTLSDTLF